MVMCREKCPCADIPAEGLKSYPELFQTEYATWTTSDAKNGYKFGGEIKNFSECMTKLAQSPEDESKACIAKNTINNIKKKKESDEVFEARNKASVAAAKTKCAAAAKAKVQITKLLKSVETELKCQGLCKPSMWWWYGDITTGAPTQGCLKAIKQKFNGSSHIAAWVVLVALIVSFCLNICTCGAICNTKE